MRRFSLTESQLGSRLETQTFEQRMLQSFSALSPDELPRKIDLAMIKNRSVSRQNRAEIRQLGQQLTAMKCYEHQQRLTRSQLGMERAQIQRQNEIEAAAQRKADIERLKQLKKAAKKEKEEQQKQREVRYMNTVEANPQMTAEQVKHVEATQRLMALKALAALDKESYSFCSQLLEEMIMVPVEQQAQQYEKRCYSQSIARRNDERRQQNRLLTASSIKSRHDIVRNTNQAVSNVHNENLALQNQIAKDKEKAVQQINKLIDKSTLYEVGLYNKLPDDAPWGDRVQRLEGNIQDMFKTLQRRKNEVAAKKKLLQELEYQALQEERQQKLNQKYQKLFQERALQLSQ